jgi:hypothetical protein
LASAIGCREPCAHDPFLEVVNVPLGRQNGPMAQRRRRLGPNWETAIERSIREAVDRGEFADLPGAGQPIDALDGPRDELWWVKDKLRRESIQVVPPSLAVRRDREQLLASLATFQTEAELRAVVDDLNDRIRTLNRLGSPSGPPTSLMPQDVEDIVARWRAISSPTG